jgi:hypothetical protein
VRTFVPVTALVFAAIALSGPPAADVSAATPAELREGSPAPAARPHVPMTVVVRIDGGFSPVSRWLWYDSDGTARAKGLVVAEPGTFRARTELARVEQIVEEMGLCERPAALFHPAGSVFDDVLYYKLSVRCPGGWRYFTSTDTSQEGVHVREAIRRFEMLGANLRWETTDERITPPDSAPYHTAR